MGRQVSPAGRSGDAQLARSTDRHDAVGVRGNDAVLRRAAGRALRHLVETRLARLAREHLCVPRLDARPPVAPADRYRDRSTGVVRIAGSMGERTAHRRLLSRRRADVARRRRDDPAALARTPFAQRSRAQLLRARREHGRAGRHLHPRRHRRRAASRATQRLGRVLASVPRRDHAASAGPVHRRRLQVRVRRQDVRARKGPERRPPSSHGSALFARDPGRHRRHDRRRALGLARLQRGHRTGRKDRRDQRPCTQ